MYWDGEDRGIPILCDDEGANAVGCDRSGAGAISRFSGRRGELAANNTGACRGRKDTETSSREGMLLLSVNAWVALLGSDDEIASACSFLHIINEYKF
jgi:hypothetical protein